METIIIKIPKAYASELQELLDMYDMDFQAMDVAEDSTLEVFTAKFSNGYEADIKVCAGQTNCFIDPVIFNKRGYEIGLLDVEDELLGSYEFEVDGELYTIVLEEE